MSGNASKIMGICGRLTGTLPALEVDPKRDASRCDAAEDVLRCHREGRSRTFDQRNKQRMEMKLAL
jgi:hypothetical protein